MNITKALKRKNKLIAEIRKEWQKVEQYNQMSEGQVRPYDIGKSYGLYLQLKQDLVELKSKIHLANAKVYHLIFEMSEIKETLEQVKNLRCETGAVRFNSYDKETQQMTSIISVQHRDEQVRILENRLEEIQDLLETHNATTNI
jgi:hypothetical protein